jgi:hypothetical protein
MGSVMSRGPAAGRTRWTESVEVSTASNAVADWTWFAGFNPVAGSMHADGAQAIARSCWSGWSTASGRVPGAIGRHRHATAA